MAKLVSSTLFAALAVSTAFAQGDIDQLMARYVHKQVVLRSSVFFSATFKGGHYQPGSLFIPASLVGTTATIEAFQVEYPSPRETSAKTNALGEALSPMADERHIWVVLRLEDGRFAMGMVNDASLPRDLPLVDDIKAAELRNEKADAEAQNLIGSKLFAVAYSYVYAPDASLEDIYSGNCPKISVPLLAELKVVKAKWDPGMGKAIVRVEFQGGMGVRYGLAVVSLKEDPFSPHELLRQMPRGLSQREIEAIRSRSPMTGISRAALYFAIGSPETINDYGESNFVQLVYPDGLLIYVGHDGIVRDIQRLGQR